MKMQNAEMEFVAFDAQDVIVTSGSGPAAISFQVTSSLFDLREGWVYDGTSRWNPQGSHDEFAILGNYLSLSKDKYYTITKGASYSYSFDTNGELVFLDGFTEGQNGTTYNSLSSIIGWLSKNGNKQ